MGLKTVRYNFQELKEKTTKERFIKHLFFIKELREKTLSEKKLKADPVYEYVKIELTSFGEI